ncbi:hypothetical protein VCRA2126O85_520005 [Vibrio crassostreae]|nr:hypothetical protein VCRA2126O86_520005 [Vibrio crassostreae]CAK3014141.1 hypothetical protein VCRA2125O83_510005 [Vibrio crassostreae]CAK3014338.1 hypothetical protein VCRA2128O106_530005 [Vibrio crassostreae]CAK3016310.1 hypothetical protein VCRA2127O91_520005 [Vibrio crassostreae]CAK3016770.1 hypothetical protein VCRA2126O85_520005 [Vibrio crassostreae]
MRKSVLLRHEVLKKKDFTSLRAPRKNARRWEESYSINEAEKALTSGKASLRYYNAQIGEMIVNVKTMNKIIALGMPVRSLRLAINDVALSPGRFYQHNPLCLSG